MAYIDYGFYINVYKGAHADAQDFDLYSERACDIIDGITDGRASMAAKNDVEDNSAEKRAAEFAACAQTEYLLFLGETDISVSRKKKYRGKRLGMPPYHTEKKKAFRISVFRFAGLRLCILRNPDLF